MLRSVEDALIALSDEIVSSCFDSNTSLPRYNFSSFCTRIDCSGRRDAQQVRYLQGTRSIAAETVNLRTDGYEMLCHTI